jgi:hypothetical protein
MANSTEGGVYFVDTDDTTLSTQLRVKAIKYIGNTSGTAVIKSGSSAGDVMWQESGANNVFNEVKFRAKDGLHIALTNSAKVYIYVE